MVTIVDFQLFFSTSADWCFGGVDCLRDTVGVCEKSDEIFVVTRQQNFHHSRSIWLKKFNGRSLFYGVSKLDFRKPDKDTIQIFGLSKHDRRGINVIDTGNGNVYNRKMIKN